MNNNENKYGDIPTGLSMEFAQNSKAMLRFAEMDENQRNKVIAHAHAIRSKQEMQAFVAGLTASGNVITD